MTLTEEIRRLADTKPVYAVAGCGDLAIEKLRGVPGQLHQVQVQLQEIVPADRTELQERARGYAGSLTTMATGTYDDLAQRGRGVVGRVRRQEATQELASRAQTASRQTKAATTSARKTAESAQRAASESAEKLG